MAGKTIFTALQIGREPTIHTILTILTIKASITRKQVDAFVTQLALLNANGGEPASFYLVDPQGNVMLRYPNDPDARRVLKDLEHLLRLSRVG